MARNLLRRFQDLTAGPPLQVGTVTAINGDGTTTLQIPAGGFVRVRGAGVPIGQPAYYRGDELRGQAPAATPVTIDV
ncbi:MAG: hypothetical protein ABF296_09385 [Oceanococcaceae bacterium]